MLGLATPEEIAEIESYCAQYSDIKKAVDDFAALIERNAMEEAVAPPSFVKEKIMAELASEFAVPAGSSVAPVVSMPVAPDVKVKRLTAWRYVAAACIILLIASTALNIYFYKGYKTATDQYQALLINNNSLQASNNVFQTRLNDFEESMRIMQNPDVLKINMPGVAGKETNLAAVYWDTKTKDVYFLPTKLDAAPEGKQYQLWAIVDGQPVSAGLVEDCNGLCKMKNIPKAQAFAITLEKKGGVDKPTLSAMYVLGKV